MRNLISILTANSPADRRWCGNDEKGRFRHHNAIPMAEDPLILELHWKSSDLAPENYIGTYRLHLAALLENGFIRADPRPDHVRVQFVNDGGVIRLTVGAQSPGLTIGRFEG